MIKSTVAIVLVLGLVGSARAQDMLQPQQQQQQQRAGGNPLGGLLDGLQGQQARQGQQPQGLLGGLGNLGAMLGRQQGPQMGGAGQTMTGGQQQGNLLNMLQYLPERGMQMLNQLLMSVRNMLPAGLGRNMQPGGLARNGSFPEPQQSMGPLASPGAGLNLAGLGAQGLSQGRLPDIGQLSQQLPQMADKLVPGLSRAFSDVLPRARAQA